MRIEGILSRIFISVAFLIIVFIGLECLSRLYLWSFTGEELFNKYASLNQLESRYEKHDMTRRRLSPHRYLGYYPTPNFKKGLNRHNSLGFRGEEIKKEKPENVFRIVCLGGSTTYSGIGDFRESYPYMLQKILREKGFTHVEVINAGADGYTSWENLINLQFRILELEPDMIIVYNAMNDVQSRLVWPPSAYSSDNSGARISNVSSVRMPPIWHYSTFLRYLLIRFGYDEPHNALNFTLIKTPPSSYSKVFKKQFRLKKYPEGIFREVPAEEMIKENKPKYYQTNLRSIIAVARKNSIKTVLATFAYSPLFKDEIMSNNGFSQGIRELNDIVRDLASEAHVFDFEKNMPIDEQYYADGRHFSTLGNKYRAELFAKYLIDNDLIK